MTLKSVMPKTLPFGWKLVKQDKKYAIYNEIIMHIQTKLDPLSDQPEASQKRTSLNVGLGVTLHEPEIRAGGKCWMRLIVGRPHSWPAFDDLMLVKRIFFGPERYATVILKNDLDSAGDQKFQVALWCDLTQTEGRVTL